MIIGGLDLETTGLDQAKGHRIIEVALLFYTYDQAKGDLGTYRGKYVQRINPQRPIDPGAQAVHGISFDDVAMCPTWDEVAPKLAAKLMHCDVVVAHNGEGFDMPFLRMEFIRVGVALPEFSTVDTMLKGRWATPNGKVPNLGELCFASGVEYDKAKAHGAEYDVSVMMQSFFAGLKMGFFELPKGVCHA